MKQFLEIGKIVGTHGIKGEVRVEYWADSGEFLTQFKRLYFDEGKNKLDITSARPHKSIVIMKIKGTDTVSGADTLRGKVLYMNRDDAKLPPGRYFIDDLIGLTVIDSRTKETLGTIENVTSTAANEVYHIKGAGGKMVYIAAIDSVIAKTDIPGGFVSINVMKGMFDDED